MTGVKTMTEDQLLPVAKTWDEVWGDDIKKAKAWRKHFEECPGACFILHQKNQDPKCHAENSTLLYTLESLLQEKYQSLFQVLSAFKRLWLSQLFDWNELSVLIYSAFDGVPLTSYEGHPMKEDLEMYDEDNPIVSYNLVYELRIGACGPFCVIRQDTDEVLTGIVRGRKEVKEKHKKFLTPLLDTGIIFLGDHNRYMITDKGLFIHSFPKTMIPLNAPLTTTQKKFVQNIKKYKRLHNAKSQNVFPS